MSSSSDPLSVLYVFWQSNLHHFDPYADTRCSICGGMQDECYLLLCDLCDSAAHTYCAGLGYAIPSSDWFCNDCSILRQEYSNIDEDCIRMVENPTIRMIKEPVSVLEIVQEEPSNRAVETLATVSAEAREPLIVVEKASDFDARTVHRCRNVPNRIQFFRENWEAFRQGCLYFSSKPVEHSKENSAKRRRICSAEHDETNQPSASSRGVTDEGAGSSAPPQDNYDIDRAWKMMDKARSKQSTHSSTSKMQQRGKSADRRYVSCNDLQSRNPLMRTQNIIQSIRSMNEERRKQITHSDPTALHVNDFSAKLADTSKRRDQPRPLIPAKEGRSEFTVPPVSNFSGASMGKHYRRNHQPPLTLLSSVSFTAAPWMSTSTHQPRGEDRGQKVSTANHSGGENGMESAKREIQSLVKDNLKLLSSRKLETNSFKQIARGATHTILAACGFEDSKSAVPAIQASVCPHAAHSRRLPKSSLMPGSCRDCFCTFMRDVVESTMTQKLGTPK